MATRQAESRPLTVEFSATAAKQFAELPESVKARVVAKIEALCTNPYPGGTKKLSGRENMFRARVGDYRILYQVEKERRVLFIARIEHRKQAYRR